MKIKNIIIYGIAAACIAAYGEEGPKEIIMKKDTDLKNAIEAYHKNPTIENRVKLTSGITDVFDFHAMGQKALPKAAWDGADPKTREAYSAQFRRMIERSSTKWLESYRSDSAFYDLAQQSAKEATVSAQVWFKGRRTTVCYKMTKNNSSWNVWDLVIDDVSTVRNYREQFKTILESKSLSDLIDILRKKADSLENQSRTATGK